MSKVLIIEPDEKTRYLYKTAVDFQKLQTIAVASAKEAMPYLDSSLSLALVDIDTPDLADINIIKEIQDKTKIPLVLIADMKSNDEVMEHCIDGACEYLAKSNLKVGDIIRKIRKIIDENSSK